MAVVPAIITKVYEITKAATGIILALLGHSVVGQVEKWQRRAAPIEDVIGGEPSVISRGSRPIEAI